MKILCSDQKLTKQDLDVIKKFEKFRKTRKKKVQSDIPR